MRANDAYKRRIYVHDLRTKGLLFKEIAKILNISDNRARQLYESAKRIKECKLLNES
jgi:orotate phosphoribosyltransferase-like protein